MDTPTTPPIGGSRSVAQLEALSLLQAGRPVNRADLHPDDEKFLPKKQEASDAPATE